MNEREERGLTVLLQILDKKSSENTGLKGFKKNRPTIRGGHYVGGVSRGGIGAKETRGGGLSLPNEYLHVPSKASSLEYYGGVPKRKENMNFQQLSGSLHRSNRQTCFLLVLSETFHFDFSHFDGNLEHFRAYGLGQICNTFERTSSQQIFQTNIFQIQFSCFNPSISKHSPQYKKSPFGSLKFHSNIKPGCSVLGGEAMCWGEGLNWVGLEMTPKTKMTPRNRKMGKTT